MTAGSGLLHTEYHEQEYNRSGGTFQMVQLWVNLPAIDKMTEPKYQAITNVEMGRVPVANGGEIEIIAGELAASINDADKLPTDHLALFERDGESIKVEASEDSILLVMSGDPLNEPIAQYGPFLMKTQIEIAEALEDYRAGKFGYLAD